MKLSCVCWERGYVLHGRVSVPCNQVGKYADDTGLHDAYVKRLDSSFIDNTQYTCNRVHNVKRVLTKLSVSYKSWYIVQNRC